MFLRPSLPEAPTAIAQCDWLSILTAYALLNLVAKTGLFEICLPQSKEHDCGLGCCTEEGWDAMHRNILNAVLILLLTACQLPKDPEGTTQHVEGATLRVGILQDPLPEIDATALDLVARRLKARIELVEGNPHDLLDALSRGDLHVLAGGIPKDTPLAKHAGMTNAIGHVTVGADRPQRVLLIRKGENRFLLRLNTALRPMTREAME